MKRDDLYFMLNPALGIIKIGITYDVPARRRSLEHACGVPLEVLRVVEGGAHHEQPLHEAFGEHRLMGEWFNPTDEILALIDGTETIEACLARKGPATKAWVAAREDRAAAQREAQKAAAAAEREEAARLKAEERRLAAEHKKAIAAARAKAQLVRDEQAAVRRAAAEAERAKIKMGEVGTGAFSTLFRAEPVAAAAARRDLLAQRSRNAAFLGVKPYETQRSATVDASEIS